MQELNLSLLAEIGGWPALKEARALVERGKVTDAQRDGKIIRARVQGAEKVYEPRIVLAERVADIEVKCTCIESRKTGRVCAHALAAGVALLEGRRRTPGGGAVAAGAGPAPVIVQQSSPPAHLPEPEIEARLDGALSGLTLELIARYGEKSFPIQTSGADPSRRNVAAEKQAVAIAENAGFTFARAGASALSLTRESNVARFLANTLPRWRREWNVTFGSRLASVLTQVDVAQPEFSLRKTSGSGEDWLNLDLKLSVGGKPVPLDAAEVQRWLQTGQSHTRLPNQRVLLVPTEAWSEMQEVLADCDVDQQPGSVRVRKTFAPYLSGALLGQGFSAKENAAIDFSAPDVKAALDEKLWSQLRPYQAHGVEWLAGLAQQSFSGLLADDMGLGKTVQALVFAAWLKGRDTSPLASQTEKSRDGKGLPSLPNKILIVCPTSLVTNWLREAARFTPHLRALDLTGPDRAEKFSKRGDYDLLVTSYALLRRDIDLFRADEFSLVILDEAQHIKNRGSQNAQAAKALRAGHRLVLTGTPLENSVLDLWSIFDFLLPGYLGTATEFRDRYETPLAKGLPDKKVMARLRQRVKPFFLRRTKAEVLTELPPKLEFPALVELTDEQKEVYRAVLEQGRRDVFEHSDKQGGKSGRDRLAVLTTLLRLRQVCCHLDLLPDRSHGITKLTELTELEEGRTEIGGHRPPVLRTAVGAGPATTPRWKEPSAKMERTFELIDEAIDGGHRVLLFSQFVRVLHLLRDEAKRRDISFCYLDGQTVDRQAEVDRFQNDATVPLFFISLKAGGTGLNLTGADTVIHFDPWWNPAVEEQATSRAHRMGQSRSVQAYKLIAAGTVEEKIQALQARKRELFKASLQSDEAFVEKLSGDDLEELLQD
jgi:superfamily II DNA or RNA helicase